MGGGKDWGSGLQTCIYCREQLLSIKKLAHYKCGMQIAEIGERLGGSHLQMSVSELRNWGRVLF